MKYVPLAILKLLAFNAQKCTGPRDPYHGPVLKKFSSRVGTFPGSMRAKLEVRSFSVLELLAFNCQKSKVSRDHGHAPFSKKRWRVMWEVETVPGGIRAKFKVRIFNHFEAISIKLPKI